MRLVQGNAPMHVIPHVNVEDAISLDDGERLHMEVPSVNTRAHTLEH